MKIIIILFFILIILTQSVYAVYVFDYWELKQEYKEWVFINWHKELTGGGWCIDNNCSVKYWFIELKTKEEQNNYFDAYFRYYVTLKKLNKKWLNKPMPEGLAEFLTKVK